MFLSSHRAGCYDKLLFDTVSVHMAEHFTKYETEQLLKVCDEEMMVVCVKEGDLHVRVRPLASEERVCSLAYMCRLN